MDVEQGLEAAIDACAGWVDPAPLIEALARVRAPRRIVLIGRVAAGKSSLVNQLAGGPVQAVGLGGVTPEIREVPVGDQVLVDTPGIDDPDEALIRLQALVEGADAVVWVVDGLQPATASERDVLRHTVVAGTPMRAIVSKADLVDAAELASVVQRVADLASTWGDVAVEAHDLKAGPPPSLRFDGPGPRRLRIVADAVATLSEALAALRPPPELSDLLTAWTAAIREVVASVEDDIAKGRVHYETEALVALLRNTKAPRAAIQEVLGPDAPPRLPHPDPPSITAMDQVLASLSGQEGARRVLRAGAARWLAEGQLALREWWATQRALQARAQSRQRLEAHLEALRAAC